jgi:ABC-type nitrate/sulfonate/bicarbonate transport system substrate-binding protein
MPIRPELSRPGALLAAGAIVALLAAGCGDYHARRTAAPPRPVTVAIDAPAGALFAPLYTAEADGQFRAAALAVRVAPAPGAALLALEQGNATFAITSEPGLLAARDAGQQLVAIAELVNAPLDGVVSLASRPLGGGVRALAGHSVATSGTPLAKAQLATVLAAAHVPQRRVRAVTASGALAAALTSRHAIAALGGPWPVELAQLEQGHHPAAVLRLPALGVPTYSGLVVAVRLGEARRDGPLLRAFLQALTRGQRAVAGNPQAAAQAVARAVGGNGALRLARAVLARLEPLAGSLTGAAPWGWESGTQWRAFGAWMRSHGLLHGSADPARAITNEFLPGQGA